VTLRGCEHIIVERLFRTFGNVTERGHPGANRAAVATVVTILVCGSADAPDN
jgi:hypothetical protein